MSRQTKLARTSMRPLLLGAALGTLPGAALAAEGGYLSLIGGANFPQSQNLEIYYLNGPGPIADGSRIADVELEDGWLAGASLGYAFSNGLRAELELLHRENDLDTVDIPPIGQSPGGPASNLEGEQTIETAMANLWLDLFPGSRVRPYIGGGLGAAYIRADDFGYDDPRLGNIQLNDTEDTVFAYQAGAGVALDLSTRWTVALDYRYLDTDDPRLNLLDDVPTTRIELDYRSHSAMLTLRYAFHVPEREAPPPAEPPVEVVPVAEPPPAEPAPEPAAPPCQTPPPGAPFSLEGCKVGDRLVLHGATFEFDEDRLTANAKLLLDRVADALLARPDLQVEVQGHTDSKGAEEYNQRLSERRAESVTRYLVGRGVQGDRLTAVGYGESQPVADNETEEGRELNRRVELLITGGEPPP